MSTLQLFNGRPDKPRTAREDAAYDFLEKMDIPFRRVDHAPAMTMEDCVAIDGALGVSMCKNLFLCNRQKTDFYLLLMPGDKPFRTKELSNQLETARLSFGSAEDMEHLLGVSPGAVTVMGLINDKENRVRLLIDKDLLDDAEIGCHPLVNTSSVAFSMQALLQTLLPATRHTPTTVTLLGKDI